MFGLALGFTGYRAKGSRAPASIAPIKETSPLKAAYARPASIPFPKSNPYSNEKYILGKLLFFDPRLSGSGVMSCASCHNPSLTWGDGLPVGVGQGHKKLTRRVPTLLNLAWGWAFFWDGRVETLEAQALGPIKNPDEMNLPLAELETRLKRVPLYRRLFREAFDDEAVSAKNVARALATFERTLVSDVAPFDQWISGDENAISESAKRGFEVFNGQGRCVVCHTGWSFTNGSFADTGLDTDDPGRGKAIAAYDALYAFKTPTLRNVERRAPYMHDGSLKTLRAVIDHYDAGPKVDRVSAKRFFPKPLGLSEQQKRDLLAFLQTLTSQDEAVTLPTLPLDEREGDK